jgi:hypothetical protein
MKEFDENIKVVHCRFVRFGEIFHFFLFLQNANEQQNNNLMLKSSLQYCQCCCFKRFKGIRYISDNYL